MSFLSKLLARLSPTPSMDPPRPPPPPPEPIAWPQADASRLPDGDIPPTGDVSGVAPEIAGEIREVYRDAIRREQEFLSEIRFRIGAPVPSDPLFSDFRTECKPRAFTDRVRLGVREVYGGDAVPFYRAAGISRSAYSRLISHPEKHPSKDTALAMAAALKLDEEGADAFLELAGFSLSPSYPEDVVWRLCFRHGIHDLATIRAFLAETES